MASPARAGALPTTSHTRSLSRFWERFSGSPSTSSSSSSTANHHEVDSGLGRRETLSDDGSGERGAPSTPTPRRTAGRNLSLGIEEMEEGGEPLVERRAAAGVLPGSWGKLRRWTGADVAGKGKEVRGMLDEEDSDAEDNSFPLDGEEGVVVDDEACFVDGWEGKVDFLSSLPHEISLYILLHLDFPSLLTSTAVSQQWRTLASDNLVWRDLFHREKRWRIREDIGDVAEAYGVGAAGLGSAPPLKKTGSASVSGGATPRRSVAADGGVSGSRLGRHLSDMMADLSGLSLTPMRERRRTAASQALPSPVISDDAEPSWTSTSTATPRRPASGIVNNPFPPLSSSGTLPPLSLPTLSTSNPDDGFFLSRNPSSSGLTSLDSSLAIPGGPSRRPSSAALPPLGPVPSPSLGITPSAPLFLDWPKLYKDRYVLEQRWAKGTPKTQWLRGHTDSVYCVQFDEFKVVSGSRDQSIRIWDVRTGLCVKTLLGHLGSVLCLQYDDEILVSGSSDARILVWDLVGEPGTGKGRWEIKMCLVGHNMGVLDLCFDDQWIVSCSKDTTIRVWHKATGELYRTLSGHGGPVNAIQLLANRIISAAGDALMKMWDVETGEVMRVFTGHERGLACLQYSPSGKLIATGSNDRLVKIWDAETGECLRTLEGHTDLVRSLAFDETRGRLVTGSYDRSVRLWDLDTGESLLRFKAHASLVFDVSLSASKIVSCSHDQRIVILDFGDGLETSRFL